MIGVDLLDGHSCGTCKWWSRHECHGESNFRPCRFPLPESARDYIQEMDQYFKPPGNEVVMMKLSDAGRTCIQWEQFRERKP